MCCSLTGRCSRLSCRAALRTIQCGGGLFGVPQHAYLSSTRQPGASSTEYTEALCVADDSDTAIQMLFRFASVRTQVATRYFQHQPNTTVGAHTPLHPPQRSPSGSPEPPPDAHPAGVLLVRWRYATKSAMRSNAAGVEDLLSRGYCWRGIDDDRRHQWKAGSHAVLYPHRRQRPDRPPG